MYMFRHKKEERWKLRTSDGGEMTVDGGEQLDVWCFRWQQRMEESNRRQDVGWDSNGWRVEISSRPRRVKNPISEKGKKRIRVKWNDICNEIRNCLRRKKESSQTYVSKVSFVAFCNVFMYCRIKLWWKTRSSHTGALKHKIVANVATISNVANISSLKTTFLIVSLRLHMGYEIFMMIQSISNFRYK